MTIFHKLYMLAILSLLLCAPSTETKNMIQKMTTIKTIKKCLIIHMAANICGIWSSFFTKTNISAQNILYISMTIAQITSMPIFWFLQDQNKRIESYAFDIVSLGLMPLIRTGFCIISSNDKAKRIMNGLHAFNIQAAYIKNISEACYHKIATMKNMNDLEENATML